MDLDPTEVGEGLRRRLRVHLEQLAQAAPDGRPSPDAGARPMRELGTAVEGLVLYARQGLPVWDWRDRSSVSDALAQVLSVLYGGSEGMGVPGFLALDRDPDEPVGVALLASLARLSLERGQPVVVRELAALAGVPTIAVREQIVRGALPSAGEDAVEPARALEWLRARGVPGLERID